MVLDRLFRPKTASAPGLSLYTGAVDQARSPKLYSDLGAPDTIEGRFELYTLHVVLLLDRLRGHGARASDVSQGLFDTYVGALDHTLREMGVGDLSVGKKMRKLGEAFYGRVKSYETAFAALPDHQALGALLARTVYDGADPTRAADLAAYVLAQRATLAAQPLDGLLDGQAWWAAP
jgi:cytochrome b pre-mRNA-processing protein 3